MALRATKALAGVIALGILAAASPARAHPHVTVLAKAAIQIGDGGQITGIRHVWTFDEAYSAYATTGMKKGADGAIARQELDDLAKVNVESLADFKFFTLFKQGKSELTFDAPKEGYFLTHDGKALTLNFVLPLQKPVTPASGQTLRIDDETIFVAFSLAENDPVVFEGKPTPCKIEVRRPATTLMGAGAPKLTEDFFNNLKAGFSEQYATSIRINCP